MSQRQQETASASWGRFFLLSIGLHFALAGVVVAASWGLLLPVGGLHPGTASAGSMQANLVSQLPGGAIPLPAPTVTETKNRLASDNPAPAITKPTPHNTVPKNSIAIPSLHRDDLAKRQAQRDLSLARADANSKPDDRVAYGNGGAPSFDYSMARQGAGGGGGMAFGDAAFGTMYTDWVNHLRDRLTFYWNRQSHDPSMPSARAAQVVFTVNRAGQIVGVGFAVHSNLPDLDSMALHAVEQMANAESFPLPAGYNHDSLECRVSFALQ